MVDGSIHVDGVPEQDEIDDHAEGSKLIFLSLSITLAQFAVLSVEDDTGELVATLAKRAKTGCLGYQRRETARLYRLDCRDP